MKTETDGAAARQRMPWTADGHQEMEGQGTDSLPEALAKHSPADPRRLPSDIVWTCSLQNCESSDCHFKPPGWL